ncbi:hypothetical protein EYZ11_012156 [Aspergillus tanneri]|uniref:FAD/NAD(P)-binding domain-containing protein n=1 Tax=Aspergillus tanneri TaxID=1220188 RepID=A0A4S3J104_9EURO|nr:uncharacterized protein ATNIH1004_006619 [Aspergillus tanneri]KAA8647917.1 hypothetical protein ATNIH1004_006619 [Aspergillus tanneri]THC88396.1 hypothetical protein EYZ11_012156 [Aspergillus tanneri]
MIALNQISLFYTVLTVVTVVIAAIPRTDYDVIVVGGGPSGLSAASGLSRVLRSVALFDSGVYRNGPTRNMHDVIGSDGAVPSEFRNNARKGISRYQKTSFIDKNVTSIENNMDGTFIATIDGGKTYTARKVILGTGIKDDIPNTPGLQKAFGKGIYWCPWCDGYEHRNQTMGILGPMSEIYGSIRELHSTLNKDIVAYVNGTDTAEQKAKLTKEHPNWQNVLKAYNIRVNNKLILNITRTQDGGQHQDPVTGQMFDKFRIFFTDGSYEERDAFITNFPTEQRSHLPSQMGLQMIGPKINTTRPGLRTSLDGVWGVGDANSDDSTNVPHAMASGKKAAVYCHVELAQEELDADASAVQGRSMLSRRAMEEETERKMGSDIEDLYERLRRA